MKLEILHYGRIKAGKLIFSVPALYQQQLLELEGQEVVVRIDKKHKKPSNNQYGYYRGVVLVACYQSEEFNWCDNKDVIHETYFAPKFLSYTAKGKDGREMTLIRSLADITLDEMTEFITKVIAHCESELGIRIPTPEESYSNYYQSKE